MKERKLGLVGRVLVGASLAAGLFLAVPGCASQENSIEKKHRELEEARISQDYTGVEQEVYDFVESLATKIPEEFESKRLESGKLYYDKSLKVEDSLFNSDMMSGRGRFVRIDFDGDISAGYWCDKDQLIGFDYDKDDTERAIFSKRYYEKSYYDKSHSVIVSDFIVSYTEEDGYWMKRHCYMKKHEEARGGGEYTLLSEQLANEAELKEPLELVERIRKTYKD